METPGNINNHWSKVKAPLYSWILDWVEPPSFLERGWSPFKRGTRYSSEETGENHAPRWGTLIRTGLVSSVK
jgi:hypothetical protein